MRIILKSCPLCGQEPEFTYNLDMILDGIMSRLCQKVMGELI